MCHFCKPVVKFAPVAPVAVSYFDVAPVAPAIAVPAVAPVSLLKVAPLEEDFSLLDETILEEEDETEEEENEPTCEGCGCEIARTSYGLQGHEIGTETYCYDCAFSCSHCSKPHPNDTGEVWLEDEEEMVCDSCKDRYHAECGKCGKWKSDNDLEDGYCGSCRENMGYCEGCSTWMEQDNVYYSERNDASYCDSCRPCDCDGECAQGCQKFEINGVQQETRFSINMEDETIISRDGFDKIMSLVNMAGFYSWRSEIAEMSRAAVNSEGKFATRLGALLTKTQKAVLDAKECGNIKNVKVTVSRKKAMKDENGEVCRNGWGNIMYEHFEQEVNFLSEVGNLASQYAVKSETAWCSFTRDLNKSAGYYCNSGSCWFGSDDYSQSRCYWKHSGGFGFIQHEDETSRQNIGRLWLVPVKVRDGWNGRPQLEVTFDTEENDGFIAINGYHENVCKPTNHMVSLFAKFTGLESQSGSFSSMSGLYVNSDEAHLIAKPEILERFKDAHYFNISGWEDCGCW